MRNGTQSLNWWNGLKEGTKHSMYTKYCSNLKPFINDYKSIPSRLIQVIWETEMEEVCQTQD